MLLQPLDWSLMVPARLPTPCKSTKSRLPDAEITKGRRSLHLGIRRSTHCCNSVKFANLGNLEAPKFSVRPNSPCTKIVNCCFRGQVIFSLFSQTPAVGCTPWSTCTSATWPWPTSSSPSSASPSNSRPPSSSAGIFRPSCANCVHSYRYVCSKFLPSYVLELWDQYQERLNV